MLRVLLLVLAVHAGSAESVKIWLFPLDSAAVWANMFWPNNRANAPEAVGPPIDNGCIARFGLVCDAWFDAADDSLRGSRVTLWRDLSGRGRHLRSAGEPPLLAGGAVRFSGGAALVTAAPVAVGTACVAIRNVAPRGECGLWEAGGSLTASDSGGLAASFRAGGPRTELAFRPVGDSLVACLSPEAADSLGQAYLDGGMAARSELTDFAAEPPAGPMRLGAQENACGFDVTELVVFSEALAPLQAANVSAALAARWARRAPQPEPLPNTEFRKGGWKAIAFVPSTVFSYLWPGAAKAYERVVGASDLDPFVGFDTALGLPPQSELAVYGYVAPLTPGPHVFRWRTRGASCTMWLRPEARSRQALLETAVSDAWASAAVDLDEPAGIAVVCGSGISAWEMQITGPDNRPLPADRLSYSETQASYEM